MMQQMLQNPMIQGMMQQNPQLQTMLQNPAMMQMMSDPNFMQSMMGMMGGQGGAGAGGGLGGLAGLGGLGGLGGAGGTTGLPQTQQNPSTGGNAGGLNPLLMNQLMSNLGGANSSVPPEEQYKDQLQSLTDMGFTNKQTNIQALQATGGNVEAAVERLLAMMGP